MHIINQGAFRGVDVIRDNTRYIVSGAAEIEQGRRIFYQNIDGNITMLIPAEIKATREEIKEARTIIMAGETVRHFERAIII